MKVAFKFVALVAMAMTSSAAAQFRNCAAFGSIEIETQEIAVTGRCEWSFSEFNQVITYCAPGTVAVGAYYGPDFTESTDCYCVNPSTHGGTCNTAVSAAAKPCKAFSDDGFYTSLVCGSGNTCQFTGHYVGDSCILDTDCDNGDSMGITCVGSVCTADVAVDGDCEGGDKACPLGQYAALDGATCTCTDLVAVGGSCNNNAQCVPGAGPLMDGNFDECTCTGLYSLPIGAHVPNLQTQLCESRYIGDGDNCAARPPQAAGDGALEAECLVGSDCASDVCKCGGSTGSEYTGECYAPFPAPPSPVPELQNLAACMQRSGCSAESYPFAEGTCAHTACTTEAKAANCAQLAAGGPQFADIMNELYDADYPSELPPYCDAANLQVAASVTAMLAVVAAALRNL